MELKNELVSFNKHGCRNDELGVARWRLALCKLRVDEPRRAEVQARTLARWWIDGAQ